MPHWNSDDKVQVPEDQESSDKLNELLTTIHGPNLHVSRFEMTQEKEDQGVYDYFTLRSRHIMPWSWESAC